MPRHLITARCWDEEEGALLFLREVRLLLAESLASGGSFLRDWMHGYSVEQLAGFCSLVSLSLAYPLYIIEIQVGVSPDKDESRLGNSLALRNLGTKSGVSAYVDLEQTQGPDGLLDFPSHCNSTLLFPTHHPGVPESLSSQEFFPSGCKVPLEIGSCSPEVFFRRLALEWGACARWAYGSTAIRVYVFPERIRRKMWEDVWTRWSAEGEEASGSFPPALSPLGQYLWEGLEKLSPGEKKIILGRLSSGGVGEPGGP